MGQALFDLLTGKTLRLYPADDLRAQALNTVAIESPRGWRLAKEKASRKIDAVVALAMACVAALDVPALPPLITNFSGELRTYDSQGNVIATAPESASPTRAQEREALARLEADARRAAREARYAEELEAVRAAVRDGRYFP
jgi:hypothetical protein